MAGPDKDIRENQQTGVSSSVESDHGAHSRSRSTNRCRKSSYVRLLVSLWSSVKSIKTEFILHICGLYVHEEENWGSMLGNNREEAQKQQQMHSLLVKLAGDYSGLFSLTAEEQNKG